MNLNEILSAAGKSKSRKRVGRGTGSGHGKTSGRGHKGLGSRSGSGKRLGYEGGQNPVIARMPKSGFNNANFRKDYQIVNLSQLETCFEAGSKVDAESLVEARLIDDSAKPVKVLGNGAVTKKLTVMATKFSVSAAEKIAAAGGSAETV